MNNLVNSLRKVWDQTSVTARVSVIAMGTLSVLMIAGVAWWVMQPSYIPLANDLDPQIAAEVKSTLDDRGIAYKSNVLGNRIMVDENRWAEAIAAIQDIVPPDQREPEPGSSFLLTDPGAKERQKARHLEFRLGKTIARLKSIQSATVHLGVPERSAFINKQVERTASVTIEMQAGQRFTRDLSSLIASQVANSVEGLRRQNVKVFDTEGQMFDADETGTAIGGQLEYRRHIENDLAVKAETMLETLLGSGRSVVRVTAEVDLQKIEQKGTSYDSEEQVPASEEITTTTGTQADPLATGEAGAAANLNGGTRRSGSKQVMMESETSKTEYFDNGVEETRTTLPGGVKRLSIAAIVELPQPPGAAGDDATSTTGNESDDSATQPNVTRVEIESLIKQAVGFDDSRKDRIELVVVETMAAEEPTLLDLIEPAAPLEAWMPLIRNISLGVAALVALILGLLTLKRITPVQVPGGGDGAATITPQRARQLSELATLARKNPELLSSIMAAWINDESAGETGAVPEESRRAA